MKKIALLASMIITGCKGGNISDIGLHYCDTTSIFQTTQEDGDHAKEIQRKTEKVNVSYLNVLSKKRFAFSFQLDGLWHTDADMYYEVIGDNLVGNSVIEEQDSLDKSHTIEKAFDVSVNKSTGEITRTYTKKFLDQDKSPTATEIRTINGICNFDSQAI